MPTIISVVLSEIFNKTRGALRFIKACGAYDVHYYGCGTLNDFNKTCGALKLTRTCGANDVNYYACGALNYYSKTCGALRPLKILRS